MNNFQPNLSTGVLEFDIKRDKILEQIKDLCHLILQQIEHPNSEDYDDDKTYLDTVNSLVKQFVDKARGSHYLYGNDGYISILRYCDDLTKSHNEPKYDEL